MKGVPSQSVSPESKVTGSRCKKKIAETTQNGNNEVVAEVKGDATCLSGGDKRRVGIIQTKNLKELENRRNGSLNKIESQLEAARLESEKRESQLSPLSLWARLLIFSVVHFLSDGRVLGRRRSRKSDEELPGASSDSWTASSNSTVSNDPKIMNSSGP